jgi:hypothetical protein
MLAHLGAPNQLFHTPAGTAFADIPVKDHQETWPIRSKRFRSWLRRGYYEATGEAASAAAVRSALDLLEARAQFDGPERAVHIRTATHAGRIYLDLADEHWRAVDIGPDGWQVIGSLPVPFRRPAGMLRLPVPDHCLRFTSFGSPMLSAGLPLAAASAVRQLSADARLTFGPRSARSS